MYRFYQVSSIVSFARLLYSVCFYSLFVVNVRVVAGSRTDRWMMCGGVYQIGIVKILVQEGQGSVRIFQGFWPFNFGDSTDFTYHLGGFIFEEYVWKEGEGLTESGL